MEYGVLCFLSETWLYWIRWYPAAAPPLSIRMLAQSPLSYTWQYWITQLLAEESRIPPESLSLNFTCSTTTLEAVIISPGPDAPWIVGSPVRCSMGLAFCAAGMSPRITIGFCVVPETFIVSPPL